ncbi:MAG: polysulfide reductase NrfD [candidate division KSB1 bacterium]|nr:polysulfide reductase NrfD [candidate division KSB1 bacterium]MDZ7274099.1 polysulfide reductase NrfD [candidate division KSB1 bacterium]MDZ7287857.1 polysulfide reductase NrfD [candidate division KSB1 bacterium]MDZ7296697.1 polysulfide reductase NrfD [candidate division KSB1 bacterium]MDZ7306933.1 polysulfide reductase NrfD [candidate division KSB1 bacterium]
MNFGFIIDNRKCIGCHACTVACKAEHDVAIGVNRTWVKYIEKGEFPHTRRLFSVMRCNHCEDAPCVNICPVTALFKRDDGIVDFDNRRCIGCKGCMQACPYDALYIDPNTHTAAKCNYCAHRIDIGLEPACVNVCPEHAIISGDLDDPFSEISQLLAREQVTARKIEKGTRPKLFYIEGDEAALKPIVTASTSQYLWSAQATGVGHFAHYAEARRSQADPAEMARHLAGENGGDGILIPAGGDQQKMQQKAQDVIRVKARRVYDAPGKGVLWGWEVSAYVWTKAVASGAWLVPFLALFVVDPSESKQWLGLALGLIFLTLTGALLVKDLDQPARFAYVLLRPQWGSWLVRGGYIITIYGGLLTLWGLAKYFGWSGIQAFTLWGSAIFAILTAVYTAFLFAQAKGRDFWQSPTLPLHMLVHAFMAGAAVFGLLASFSPAATDWRDYLRFVLYGSLAFNLVVITVELLTTHPTEDAKATVKMIVSGRFSKLFWLGTIILGNIAPLLLLWSGAPPLLGLAGVLVLIGIYITEHLWVRAPQLIPLS